MEWKFSEAGGIEMVDPVLAQAFADAARRARRATLEACGSELSDMLLRVGGLDCTTCGLVLEHATGRYLGFHLDPPKGAVPDVAWSPELVGQLARTVTFPKAAGHPAPWAVASAWEFLTTCAALGLGIQFE